MKVRLVAIAVVCVALASGAWAEVPIVIGGFTTRAVGMGGAAIGVADDAGAWSQNPAGLAALNVQSESEYASDAMFSYANVDENNWYNITWSGWKPSEAFGAGAGFLDMATDAQIFGVGFGAGFKNMPLSGGFSISNVDAVGRYQPGPSPEQFDAFDGEFTYLTAGLMYRIAQGDDKAPIRIGLIATDITEQVLPNMIWSAGFSWAATNNLLIAVDAIDLTDELEEDIMVNGGIEYGFDAGDGRTIYGRAGMADNGEEHDLTLGLGYRYGVWHADFAWVDSEPESVWSLGLGINL